LVDSAKSPETKNEGLSGAFMSKTFSSIKWTVLTWIEETFDLELLDESGETSSENNSSVVSLLSFENRKYLFTGDSGIPALQNVINYAENNSIDISNVNWKQVPHHGSHRNISPEILDKIKTEVAYVSASDKAPKHPSYRVTNAYIRRGAVVYTTEGSNLLHRLNSPLRENYCSIESYPFKNKVQEWLINTN
jgi:beta-lactamase superfamily II metal-dependent hydrolase